MQHDFLTRAADFFLRATLGIVSMQMIFSAKYKVAAVIMQLLVLYLRYKAEKKTYKIHSVWTLICVPFSEILSNVPVQYVSQIVF